MSCYFNLSIISSARSNSMKKSERKWIILNIKHLLSSPHQSTPISNWFLVLLLCYSFSVLEFLLLFPIFANHILQSIQTCDCCNIFRDPTNNFLHMHTLQSLHKSQHETKCSDHVRLISSKCSTIVW